MSCLPDHSSGTTQHTVTAMHVSAVSLGYTSQPRSLACGVVPRALAHALAHVGHLHVPRGRAEPLREIDRRERSPREPGAHSRGVPVWMPRGRHARVGCLARLRRGGARLVALSGGDLRVVLGTPRAVRQCLVRLCDLLEPSARCGARRPLARAGGRVRRAQPRWRWRGGVAWCTSGCHSLASRRYASRSSSAEAEDDTPRTW